MKALCNVFVLLLASIGLASCGGGGGGSNSAFGGSPAFDISISASPSSVTTNSFTTLTVSVKNPGGSNAPNGTAVTASLSPANLGSLSGSGGTGSGATATNSVTGGQTTFLFNASNQAGTAHIVVTAASSSQAIDITVAAGNSQDPRLKLTASATTLPLNPFGGATGAFPYPGNYIGSPFVAEITVTWRHSNGSLVTGTLPVNVSIDPVAIAGFSMLDDPATAWTDVTKPQGNEFLTILGSGPVNVTGGNGVIFVHSFNTPGTTELTVTAIDPDNGQTISSQIQFTVVGAASTLPTSVSAFANGAAYIASSGGPQSTTVEAVVTDGNDAFVPDPSGFNNVEFEIVGPAGTDARLTAGSETGTKIDTVTHSGIAAVTFLAGAQQGPVQIRVTADRGDGNVDNGIQDAVSATATVTVSDGRLFSLTLTSPGSQAPSILVNRVSGNVSLANGANTIPPDPDATYSFTVSAIGTDRQGNPVLPGTQIKFGSIDSPVDAAGNYQISGNAGDPQEGGTLFTATDGHFTTAGGGAGPGDTLLVFGKLVDGNADLESADKIASIQSATTLHVQNPFNWNDTTGNVVNYGPVLPYIIGRAQIGNITSPSLTNEIGVATTTLNYPVSALGHVTAIWAQGDGVNTATHPGSTDVVTDIALAAFPGLAPAKIIISPSPIPGNISLQVNACIYDALGSPLSGVVFQFAFNNMGVGSGKLDGISGTGTVPQATGPDGCVSTTVSTIGVTGGTGSGGSGTPNLSFTAGTATASADIVAAGNLVLEAIPSAFAAGASGTVKLVLLDGSGNPVPNVLIVGTCTASGGTVALTKLPGTTDANGTTTATILANLNGFGSAGTGTCTFTTSTGSPTATVTLTGVDQCTLNTSPPPTQCGSGSSTSSQVSIQVTNTKGTVNTISTNPSAFICTISANPVNQVCSGMIAPGAYALTLGSGTATWGGACAGGFVTGPSSASTLNCTLTINP